MTSSRRVWEAYPAHYRSREMETLANWVQASESGSIVGLAGAGKSNLLGFLTSRPEVLASYLEGNLPKLAPVFVDLNNLPNNELATFFRVILRSLHESRGHLATIEDALPSVIERLYRKVEAETDPFLSQSALREVLLEFRRCEIRLVLVLDPFDQFCRDASTQVLDNLRGLRDGFKATLSYIVGLRREMVYLRDPIELGELYEILDTHVCWVGPMESRDARWVISQVEWASNRLFEDDQVEQLIHLTGGYPALLRAASLWLSRAEPQPKAEVWLDYLSTEPAIQNRLQDLRLGLTGEEAATLSVLEKVMATEGAEQRSQSVRQIERKSSPVLARLQEKLLCTPTPVGWRLFSPLFARFIATMEGVSDGRIWYLSEEDRLFRGERELKELSGKDRLLLRHFLAHPRKTHSIDALIEAGWQGDDPGGVSNEAVQQAIRHLRTGIEPNPAEPVYLITERGSGYRFFPEGAPSG